MAQTGAHGWLASRQFVQSVLDALPQHVAVLDQQGKIVATNAAWRRIGRNNGLDDQTASRLGVDYFDVCKRAAGRHAAVARDAADGVSAVADGRRAAFELEYPWPSASEERWFVMRVTRFEGAGQIWLVVAHDNTTERNWPSGRRARQRNSGGSPSRPPTSARGTTT